MSAGAVGRLAPMAVKLNGVRAKTKPSSGRYSVRFQKPGSETGCMARSWAMKVGFQRQKSMISQAESISACCTLFDWPSMVAAFRVARHGPETRSAARRSTAARSCGGTAPQARRAGERGLGGRLHLGRAGLVDARQHLGRGGAGRAPRRSGRCAPPCRRRRAGSPAGRRASSARRASRAARSGVPGAWVRTVSLRGGGRVKVPFDMVNLSRWRRRPTDRGRTS